MFVFIRWLTSITRTLPFLKRRHGSAKSSRKAVARALPPVRGVKTSSPLGRVESELAEGPAITDGSIYSRCGDCAAMSHAFGDTI